MEGGVFWSERHRSPRGGPLSPASNTSLDEAVMLNAAQLPSNTAVLQEPFANIFGGPVTNNSYLTSRNNVSPENTRDTAKGRYGMVRDSYQKAQDVSRVSVNNHTYTRDGKGSQTVYESEPARVSRTSSGHRTGRPNYTIAGKGRGGHVEEGGGGGGVDGRGGGGREGGGAAGESRGASSFPYNSIRDSSAKLTSSTKHNPPNSVGNAHRMHNTAVSLADNTASSSAGVSRLRESKINNVAEKSPEGLCTAYVSNTVSVVDAFRIKLC